MDKNASRMLEMKKSTFPHRELHTSTLLVTLCMVIFLYVEPSKGDPYLTLA